MKDKFKKVLFRYHSDVLGKVVVETMWAKEIDQTKGVYKLDSIPFYGVSIASGDEFLARFDEQEQMLTYQEIISPSGNSIVLVLIIKDDYDKEILREVFRGLNCDSEGLNDRYFAMEVPVSINYELIREKLFAFQKQQIIDYAEPCLSDKHKGDLNI